MQNQPLKDQVAFITGGARGIGRAIAKRLAQAGASIAVNYYNSVEEAEKLCQELRDSGVEAISIHGSVADPNSIKEMIQTIESTFGKLDILVSNAASGVLKPIMEMGVKHWRWCMETNALALPLLLKEAIHLMKPGARVFALTSLGSERAIPDYGFIGASKAALESLVRSLSLELAPKGISLNTISAGAVDTDALKYFPEHDRLIDEAKQRSLVGRIVEPEDVANVVYLLTLPEAEMIRGQTIYVDAGYNIIG
jgi:enoyl-[acyl-carrier protein] reductase III